MRRLTLLALVLCTPAFAQQWSGILAPSRASSSWSQAGAGTIPERTTVCSTLNAGATAAQINSAIAACPAGQVVKLSAGTYSIGSPGIVFNDKSDVTLRGAGPTQTTLNFTGSNNCGGMGGDVCFINGDQNWSGDPGNTASWTGGYSQGSTQITLSSTANLKVGTVIVLDQLNDTDTDNGGVWQCGKAGVCASEGQSGTGRSGRQQMQLVRVTAISGSTVTITPSIRMPNWRSDRSPGAWWSSDTPVTGSGIENMKLNHSGSSGAESGIYFFNAYNCWVKNVASITGPRNHVWLYQSAHITVRDSYFFDTKGQESESYGVEHFQSSDNLVENNIFQHIAAPMLSDGGDGSVFGYNYSINDFYNVSGWAQGSAYHHGPGNNYFLWEGNDGFGLMADNVHGTAHFITAFRNRFQGWEQGKSLQTVPVHIYAANRFFNVVGNVLGDATYHTTYSAQVGGSSSGCDRAIYGIGWGGNCGGASLPNDPVAVSSLLRWGNYDTVNDAARFVASEVPSGASLFPNPVPSNQTLPNSFYLSAKPTFFGSVPWPAIGPDVTGGSESGMGGHNAKIPARRCFETTMGGSFGDTAPRTFDAATCYSSTPQVRPKVPTGVSATG
jgi:hypothetical protein